MDESDPISDQERTPNRITWDDCVQSGWSRFCHEMYAESKDEDEECSLRGFVSCWVGFLPDEAALEMYLGEDKAIWEFDTFDKITNMEAQEFSPFWNDLDIQWVNLGLLRGCECLSIRQVTSAVPIRELVKSFPHSSHFGAALDLSCERLGILAASTALCLYDFDYDDRGVFAFGLLRFIGSFQYIFPTD